MNREAWLTELAAQVQPMFKGFKIKPYRITCGWPCKEALGKKRRRVGECHAIESSKDGVHEIFISPLLDAPLEVAGTVCHELAHVVAGIPAGHGKGFRIVCKHVGLTTGRPASIMPGPALNERLQKIIDKQGAYPHKALVPLAKPAKAPSVVRLECCDCGCVVVISNKWLENSGSPTCGCGGFMSAEEKGE